MIAKEIIDQLQLQPHPEGGFYKETYRSLKTMQTAVGRSRNISTAIYYLLENGDKSHFHRIKSDELWFFHQGTALEIVSIQNGELNVIILGNSFSEGEVPQAMIPADTWFAAALKHQIGFALVSCTVAPGFDFMDFEIATREMLLDEFPDLKDVVTTFTKEQ